MKPATRRELQKAAQISCPDTYICHKNGRELSLLPAWLLTFAEMWVILSVVPLSWLHRALHNGRRLATPPGRG